MFFIGPIRRSYMAATGHMDEALTLANDKVILKVLTQADAPAFLRLYSHSIMNDQEDHCPVLTNDTPESFALRIVAACELIWTIRWVSDPAVIIGDCALHHWEKENARIEFGGTLLPTCWGRGIMGAALQLVTQHALEQYEINALTCTTAAQNAKAVRFAEKMGFSRIGLMSSNIQWEKVIC